MYTYLKAKEQKTNKCGAPVVGSLYLRDTPNLFSNKVHTFKLKITNIYQYCYISTVSLLDSFLLKAILNKLEVF